MTCKKCGTDIHKGARGWVDNWGHTDCPRGGKHTK